MSWFVLRLYSAKRQLLILPQIFSNANFTSSSQPLVKAPQATPFDVIIQTDLPSGDSFVDVCHLFLIR